jgi:tetratricopeptide (TPR) repeat protein
VQLDSARNEFRIGPPHEFLLGRSGQIAEDRLGRTVAATEAPYTYAKVEVSGHVQRIGPLDECRYVAVSPDGQWLATGSHHLGAQVWRVRDAQKLAELPVHEASRNVSFSPDGKWLMTAYPPCKLWLTGTWALARELGGTGLCFSPDSRLVAIEDASKIIRLVEAETGRVIARLESPDSPLVKFGTFSPDGSRLVLVPENYPAVRVWDLRAVRKRLVAMGLDWEALAIPDEDRSSLAVAPLPAARFELGPLAGEIEQFTESPATLIERHTARIKNNPSDAEAYHHRGHALLNRRRTAEAIEDLNIALGLRPDDAHLQKTLAQACNNRAWELATGRDWAREAKRAVALARRAVLLAPNEPMYDNTLGVALYRACQYAEAITTLERNLAASQGEYDGFDLYFLAMAYHRQGKRERARDCFERAEHWMKSRNVLPAGWGAELAAFCGEAERVLGGPAGELPDDVFAPVR